MTNQAEHNTMSSPRRLHVLCYWDTDWKKWRAHWVADPSMSWLGDTPEEAIKVARCRLATANPAYDVPAMVVVEVDDSQPEARRQEPEQL